MKIDYLIVFLLGGLFFGIVIYVYMRQKSLFKNQKRKIAHFIKGMKRLKKAGKTANMEKSIKTFAERCMNFDRESFMAFKKPEFVDIANILLSYDNEHVPYPNTQENTVENVVMVYTSEACILHEVEKLLKKIIYA